MWKSEITPTKFIALYDVRTLVQKETRSQWNVHNKYSVALGLTCLLSRAEGSFFSMAVIIVSSVGMAPDWRVLIKVTPSISMSCLLAKQVGLKWIEQRWDAEVGENLGRCLRTKFVYFLRVSSFFGNLCIWNSVHVACILTTYISR